MQSARKIVPPHVHRLSIAERCAHLSPSPEQLRALELGVLAERGPGAIRPSRRRHFALLHQYLAAYNPSARRNDGQWRAELVKSLAHIGILCKFLTTAVTHQLSELHTHLDTIYEEHAFLMSIWTDHMAPFWTVRRCVFDAVMWDSRKWSPAQLQTELMMQRWSLVSQLTSIPRRAVALASAMADLLTPTAALTYDMLRCTTRTRKDAKGRKARCGTCVGCSTYQANKARIAWRDLAADVYGRCAEPQTRSTARLASQMALQAARGDLNSSRARGTRKADEHGKGGGAAFRIRMLGDRKYLHPQDEALFLEEAKDTRAAGPILKADVYAVLMVMGATLSAPDLEWTSEPGLPVAQRFWCVMTGDAIRTPQDGFYWVYTVPGAAPVVLTVSKGFLLAREMRMRMFEQGASFEQISRVAPLRGVELALFLQGPPPGASVAGVDHSTLGDSTSIPHSGEEDMASLRAQLELAKRAQSQAGGTGDVGGTSTAVATVGAVANPTPPKTLPNGTTTSRLPTTPPVAPRKQPPPPSSLPSRPSNNLAAAMGIAAPRPPLTRTPSVGTLQGGAPLAKPPPTPPPKATMPPPASSSSVATTTATRAEPGQRAHPPRAARRVAEDKLAAAETDLSTTEAQRRGFLADVILLQMQMHRRGLQNCRHMLNKLDEPGYEVTDEISDDEDDEEGDDVDEEEEEEEDDSEDDHRRKKKPSQTQPKSKPKPKKSKARVDPNRPDVGELGEEAGDDEPDSGSDVEHPDTLTGLAEGSEDDSTEAAKIAREMKDFLAEDDDHEAAYPTKSQRLARQKRKRDGDVAEEESEDDDFDAAAADADESGDGDEEDEEEGEAEGSDESEESVARTPKKKLRKLSETADGHTQEGKESHIGYYYTTLSMVDLPENWVCIPGNSSACNLLSAIILELSAWRSNKQTAKPEVTAFWTGVSETRNAAKAWISEGKDMDIPLVHFLSVMRELFFQEETFRVVRAGMKRFEGVTAWTEQPTMEEWQSGWLPNGTHWGKDFLRLLAERMEPAADLVHFLRANHSVAQCRKELYTLLTPRTVALLVCAVKLRVV